MTEWVTAREAAAVLGVTTSHLRWLSLQGRLVTEVRKGRRWVDRGSLERLAATRAQEAAAWVSYNEAARIVGCVHNTIWRAVRAGELHPRVQDGTALPALRRTEVEAWAARYAERHETRARAAAARRAAAEAVEAGPPDDGHVWLTSETAALVLGMSTGGVRYRARHGLIPHVRRAGVYWFRRDHVEQAAAARAFARRHDETAPPPRG